MQHLRDVLYAEMMVHVYINHICSAQNNRRKQKQKKKGRRIWMSRIRLPNAWCTIVHRAHCTHNAMAIIHIVSSSIICSNIFSFSHIYYYYYSMYYLIRVSLETCALAGYLQYINEKNNCAHAHCNECWENEKRSSNDLVDFAHVSMI